MKVFQRVAVGAVLALFGCIAIAQDEVGPPIEKIPGPPKWESSLEFGIVGSSGNTVEEDYNFAFKMHRATDKFSAEWAMTYYLSTTDGKETDNRLFATGRHTWLFTDSKWGIFVQSSLDNDKFKAWDRRITLHAGPSYRFIKNDKTFLEGRIGVGGVGTYGGEFKDTTDAEMTIGVTLRHQFTDKLKFNGHAEFLPNLEDTDQYRFLGKAELEYSLAKSWSIKAGVEEVFDSSPDPGDEEGDFYYFMRLAWKF